MPKNYENCLTSQVKLMTSDTVGHEKVEGAHVAASCHVCVILLVHTVHAENLWMPDN